MIELAAAAGPQTIRNVSRMRATDIANAFWLVEANTEYLLTRWRQYHG